MKGGVRTPPLRDRSVLPPPTEWGRTPPYGTGEKKCKERKQKEKYNRRNIVLLRFERLQERTEEYEPSQASASRLQSVSLCGRVRTRTRCCPWTRPPSDSPFFCFATLFLMSESSCATFAPATCAVFPPFFLFTESFSRAGGWRPRQRRRDRKHVCLTIASRRVPIDRAHGGGFRNCRARTAVRELPCAIWLPSRNEGKQKGEIRNSQPG